MQEKKNKEEQYMKDLNHQVISKKEQDYKEMSETKRKQVEYD